MGENICQNSMTSFVDNHYFEVEVQQKHISIWVRAEDAYQPRLGDFWQYA